MKIKSLKQVLGLGLATLATVPMLMGAGCTKGGKAAEAVKKALQIVDFNIEEATPEELEALVGNYPGQKCAQIFYDKSSNPQFQHNGKLHATMVLNLMGHFPDWLRVMMPIEKYQAGDLNRCKANFYIGSDFDQVVPQAFLDDYATTPNAVMWMGYHSWDLGPTFENIFGYVYPFQPFTTLDWTNLTADCPDFGNGPQCKPSFHSEISYKGETFVKYGEWGRFNPGDFFAAFELNRISETVPGRSEVISKAKNPVTGEELPWAIRAGNKFYIAEIPMVFISESDRYLIFADLLFDVLGESARNPGRYALIRMEDIHSEVDLNTLDQATDILVAEGTKPHVSLVPIFKDPYLNFDPNCTDEDLCTTETDIIHDDDFPAALADLKAKQSVFIWHGVSHQSDTHINPFSGVSGDDYEFWDFMADSPLLLDSPQWIVNRLQTGWDLLEAAGIFPKLWLTPHLHASALDNIVLGKVFKWGVARNVYYEHSATGVPTHLQSKDLPFRKNDPDGEARRQAAFANLNVTQVNQPWAGQYYAYEIYGDVYGQNIIPESLGNVEPVMMEQIAALRSANQIVECAKRNLVLRDVWASAFYHPYMLNDPANTPYIDFGGTLAAAASSTNDLEFMVRSIKELGYQFIDLNNWVDTHGNIEQSYIVDLGKARP